MDRNAERTVMSGKGEVRTHHFRGPFLKLQGFRNEIFSIAINFGLCFKLFNNTAFTGSSI